MLCTNILQAWPSFPILMKVAQIQIYWLISL